MTYIELHLHDELPQVGSGLRRFIAWPGRKWATLFHPFTLETVRLPMVTYESLRPHAVTGYKPRTLTRIIRERRKARVARGEFDGGENARKALSLLKETVKP